MSDAIDMTTTKAALRDLRRHLPGQDDLLYGFAAELAERLNDELVPTGFHTSVELLLADLRKGESGYSRPLPRALTGQPPIVYVLVAATMFERVVPIVCPADFAEAVKAFRDEVKAEVARRAPPPPTPDQAALSAEEANAYYANARRIADLGLAPEVPR